MWSGELKLFLTLDFWCYLKHWDSKVIYLDRQEGSTVQLLAIHLFSVVLRNWTQNLIKTVQGIDHGETTSGTLTAIWKWKLSNHYPLWFIFQSFYLLGYPVWSNVYCLYFVLFSHRIHVIFSLFPHVIVLANIWLIWKVTPLCKPPNCFLSVEASSSFNLMWLCFIAL